LTETLGSHCDYETVYESQGFYYYPPESPEKLKIINFITRIESDLEPEHAERFLEWVKSKNLVTFNPETMTIRGFAKDSRLKRHRYFLDNE
jgi:hypothetical protein